MSPNPGAPTSAPVPRPWARQNAALTAGHAPYEELEAASIHLFVWPLDDRKERGLGLTSRESAARTSKGAGRTSGLGPFRSTRQTGWLRDEFGPMVRSAVISPASSWPSDPQPSL